MSWEKLATAGVVTLGGICLSAWIIYLDYRRRLVPAIPEPAPRPGRGLLNTGLALLLAGAGLSLAMRAERGWPVVLGCLAVAGGSALVAVHVTRISPGNAGVGRKRNG